MDTLLKIQKVAIEVKMARDNLSHGELGDELIVDIARYKNHADCETLICFTRHDVKNPIALQNALIKQMAASQELIPSELCRIMEVVSKGTAFPKQEATRS
jgi:hypothetical protein